MKVMFALRNLTKGAIRYQEMLKQGDGEEKIGGLYIRKSAFPNGIYPSTIVVTIEWPQAKEDA